MYTLGINTATQDSAVCLIKSDEKTGLKILGEKIWNVKSKESEYLIPSVNELLKKNKITVKDIGQIILVKGPGPFTGLRIGVVFANALAENLKIPIFGINTFQVLALSSLENFDSVIVNAGGEMVFKLNNESVLAKNFNEIEIVNIKEIKKLNVVADITPKQVDLKAKSLNINSKKITFSELCYKLIEEKELNGYSEAELPVIPYYVKNPSITL